MTLEIDENKLWLKILSICIIGHECFIRSEVKCQSCELGKRYKTYIDCGLISLEI